MSLKWRLAQIYVVADRPGSVAANAGLIRSFLGVNSGFGFADGPGFGRGSQNAGVFLEISSDEYFDHTGRVALLLHKPDRLLAKNRITHLLPTTGKEQN